MKAVIFWPVMLAVVLLDVLTKALAVDLLAPSGAPQRILGDALRFALVYNPGAAFGLYLGDKSRWIFMALTGAALVILWRLYRQTDHADLVRAFAVTLVVAGALGNLIDRIRSDLGVVDFIDVGFGVHRWPTFNLADMAVSSGAFLLAWVLWGEEHRSGARTAVPATTTATVSASAGDVGESS